MSLCSYIAGLSALCVVSVSLSARSELPIDTIKLPPGFSISVYADNVKGARSLTLGDKGTVFVGTRDEGKVYAVRAANGSGKRTEVLTIASGLNESNGVAFRNGSLYVAEIRRVIRYDDIESRLNDPPEAVVVNDSFPGKAWHGWKFIAFGPDGLLYVPIGMPCNVCEQKDTRFGTIMRMKPDGSNLEIFASGIRNTVGFDWDPETKALWFTDNGRDMMGDNVPPDELNCAPQQGMHFGFPYCHGKSIPDPVYGKKRACSEFTPPVLELGPHVAALGMRFYTGTRFPERYRHGIFIAEHGSWNRSEPIGYRIMAVPVKDGKALGYEAFAEGWLRGPKAWGRPVDVLVLPDGSLLVSDDKAGVVYRIAYTGK